MSWFKNITLFKLVDDAIINKEILINNLSKHAFSNDADNNASLKGWVPPFNNDELVYDLNGQYFFALKHTSKILPASVVKEYVAERSVKIEEQQGYKPGRKQLREIKEQIISELLPKAFNKSKVTRIWIDKHNKFMAIDSATSNVIDDIIGLMSKSFEYFPIKQLHTEKSPTAVMTDWLMANEGPDNFSIDGDTQLQSEADNSKIKYINAMPPTDVINNHISSGKQCTLLALTWSDRISFVMDENLRLKKIKPLDLLKQSVDHTGKDAFEILDSDLTLMTEEVSQLTTDLLAHLCVLASEN